MNNILSLDLSTKASGWAIKIDNVLYSGCVQSSSTDVYKRISVIKNGILEIVKKYNPTKVIIEEVRPDINNSHTHKMLFYVQAVIVISIYEYNKDIEFDFILPNSWRSKIGIKTGAGIKREALKAKDILYVKQKYDIIVGDDEADAIGILDSYDVINTDKSSFNSGGFSLI